MADNQEQLYNEFADLSALESQKKAVIAIFNEVKAGIKSLAESGIKIDGAKNIQQLATAEKEFNALLKQTESLTKQLADSEAKLITIRQKESSLLAENKLKIQQLNKEQRDRIKLSQAEEGSIAQLSLKYDKAYRIYKQLSDVQRDGARGQALNKFLADTNTKLKELEGGVGNFRRNVGNYAGSLAKPFETLINKVEELKAGLKNGIGFGGGTDAQSIKIANDTIKIIETVVNKSSSSNSTSVTQVKNLSNAFRDLSVTLSSVPSAQTLLSTLKTEVGQAKDEVADLTDELKLAASDTQGIDNVVGSLNALAGIAQGAAGAYALLGASEEDAAKVTSKLIAVQGIANSIQQVGQELTRKGTIANKAYVFVQGLVATATNTTATATARLNAVLKLSTIGLVVAAIGGLIYLISKASSATSEYAQKQERLNGIVSETKDAYVKANLEVSNMKIAFEQAKTGVITKGEALKLYNDTIGKTTGQVKSLDEAEKALAKNADAYIQFTLLKAAANIALQKAAEKAFDAQFRRENVEAPDKIDQIKNAALKNPLTLLGVNRFSQAELNANIRDAKRKNAQQVKQLEEENESLLSIAKKFQKDAEELGKKYKFDFNGISETKDKKEAAAKPQKITDNTAADILKSNFELGKQEIEIIVNKNKKIFDDETQTFSDRLDALKLFTAAQMQLIKLEQQFEIDQEELKLKEIIAGLEDQKKQKGANKKAIDDQIAKEQEASDLRIKVIEGKGFAARIKATEDFNAGLKTLKDARQTPRDEEMKQIDEYEAFTLAAINKAMAAQAEGMKKFKVVMKTAGESYKMMKDVIIQASQELQETLLFFLTASIDAEIASIDTKKRIQDEETQRRINQINLLGLTEQERVKETAKVEKQAAFEREELEKRRRKLLVERAKFEKLANIASIISNTALAVMSILADKTIQGPFKIAMAAIVGGIGALQLARAVAAPLPQYFKGTDSAKKGLALVSEEGPELMKRNGQLFLTPAQPTLMEMVGGEQITPAHLTRDILNSIMFSKNMQGNGLVLLQPSGMSKEQGDELLTKIDRLTNETARSRTSLSFHFDSNWNTYITKNIR